VPPHPSRPGAEQAPALQPPLQGTIPARKAPSVRQQIFCLSCLGVCLVRVARSGVSAGVGRRGGGKGGTKRTSEKGQYLW